MLYFNRKLNFDPSSSTAIFHTFELLSYGFPIIGAIIADSWWGHFKTLLWMSLVFTIGSVIVSIGAIEILNLPVVYAIIFVPVVTHFNIKIFVEHSQ